MPKKGQKLPYRVTFQNPEQTPSRNPFITYSEAETPARPVRMKGHDMTAWESLPPALAEISAQIDALDQRIGTPDEQPSDLHAWRTLTLRYTEIAGPLGICNTDGCLNPKQPNALWCAREEALADEILAEIRAEEEARLA